MEKKKEPNIKILVACHKDDPNIRQDDIYMPVQVGKALHPDLNLGFQCDNTGDNISEKNGSYCELTALYWAWKNLKDVDYIGLCHYRRYFDMEITKDNILRILNKYDVIAVDPRQGHTSPISDLNNLLTQEDAVLMINELLSLYPNLKSSAIHYFLKNNKVSQCNMFIMKWSEFELYCDFLFKLLKNIEKKMKPHGYTRLIRNLGYMGECLQGMYFMHQKLKVKYVPKLEIGEKKQNNIVSSIKKIRNNIVFNLFTKPSEFEVYDSVRTGLKQDGIIIDKI